MTTSFSELCILWLPDQPTTRSVGTLIVNDRGVCLENVIGNLVPAFDMAQPIVTIPLVLGIGVSGTQYTCVGLALTGNTSNQAGLIGKFAVRSLYKGVHLNTVEELQFEQISWYYSNLHLWMGSSAIGIENANGNPPASVSFSCARQESWDVDIGNGFRIASGFRFFQNSNYRDQQASLFGWDGVRIFSNQPCPFLDYLRIEHRFKALINFLGDCQLEVHSVRQDQGFHNTEIFDGNVTSRFGKREDPNLIGYQQISQAFPQILSSWFQQYSALESVVNLYLFGKHNPFLDIQNTFLGLMQAVESYSRSFHAAHYLDTATYDATIRRPLVAAIPQGAPDPLKSKLRSSIRFANEFSLRRRIELLLADLPNIPAFQFVRSAHFVSRTVDTRNIMTHLIPNPEHPPMEGQELFTAILAWREAIFALVLGRIGIPEAIIENSVNQMVQRRGYFVPV